MARRSLLLSAVLIAGALAVPASAAEPQPGIGVGTQFAGDITASTVLNALPTGALDRRDDTTVKTVPGYDVHGFCTYTGHVLPNNRMEIVYGGVGFASAVVSPPQVAQSTQISCKLSNAAGQSKEFPVLAPGPVAVASDVVTNWFVSPLTICIVVTGFFGPTNPVNVATGNPAGSMTCNQLSV
jgi:hypothetical protein